MEEADDVVLGNTSSCRDDDGRFIFDIAAARDRCIDSIVNIIVKERLFHAEL